MITKAELLRELHNGPEILVLPNAWDAISGRIAEAEGFPAIATTSAGCAAVLGYPDGQRIPRAEMMFLVGKIAGAVNVPVTADLEAGYDDHVLTARDLLDVGACGLNFEDMIAGRLLPIEEHARRIRDIRDACGRDVVINARTDIYLAAIGDSASRFERTVERANAYRAAGADCLFVPGVNDADTIGRLARAIDGPVNILAVPGAPSILDMKALGVRRVSLGSGPARVAVGAYRRLCREVKGFGTFAPLANEAIPYPDVQALLTRK